MRTSLRHRGRQRLGLLTGLVVTGVAVNALVWWNSQPIGLDPSEPQELPVPDLVKQVMPSIVKVQSGSSFGTGFAIDSTTVLTNAHVIQNPNDIILTDRQGKALQPRLVGLDQGKDVAVLAVSKGTLPPLVIGSSRDALVGQAVIAIGMPMGEDYTVTSGILSA
ncbi:MAG: trypsin-like peptidase domain-containing protein, partial [Leptolyngbyaceae cyanobacterium bins.59]|nr:trypsin-like peptidase domain-containing protein [Leptolyngbyaceae cyanobacterium bins.59]